MATAPSAPSEMISGPDLGGGYLHQLSIDRRDGVTTFTHHAQDGGQDAGGPPVGGLDALGFVHPATACMFGGPRCWHRRFLLPFEATSKVRFAYQRHRFVLETMLRQLYLGEPVPFDAVFGELVARIGAPMRTEQLAWYVGGSAGLRLLGSTVVPHDIDLGVSRPGVERVAELLREFLIEPLAPTDLADGTLGLGARAFVGTPRAGARVEWAVPLDARPPLAWQEFAGADGVTKTLEVPGPGGETVRVSRPEYALVRAAARGRSDLVEAGAAAALRVGPDLELLDVLLERSSVTAERRATLRSRLAR